MLQTFKTMAFYGCDYGEALRRQQTDKDIQMPDLLAGQGTQSVSNNEVNLYDISLRRHNSLVIGILFSLHKKRH
jgi:hypothetical protein